MKLTVRKTSKRDLKTVQDLNYQLFQFDQKYDSLKMDWPYKEGAKYFEGRVSGEKGVCFIAEVDGEVAGYLAGNLNNSYTYRLFKRAELENIFIKEEFRGKGIGSKLIQEFLKWSKEQKVERVFVFGYFHDPKAISFYKKQGFTPLDLGLEIKIK